MNKMRVVGYRLWVMGVFALLALACNPDAKYATKDVEITITPYTVSAGYVECSFETNKEAYYLIDCVPAKEGYDPTQPENQKPFMMLALDSANFKYLEWRHYLLQEGETNIAPFASHCLQYGDINHFFTHLTPSTDYWIYAFAVDPDKLQPVGKLYLKKITTTPTSVVDVSFEYLVRGYWDYIYPLNPDGKINNHFPYFAATVDSAFLVNELDSITPEEYFTELFTAYAESKVSEFVRYGVQVTYNDGIDSHEEFQKGNTYYTAIVSFDGFIGNNVIYRFNWTGEDFEKRFTDEDSIVSDGEDD